METFETNPNYVRSSLQVICDTSGVLISLDYYLIKSVCYCGGGGDRCHGGGGPNAAQHCLFGTTDRWSSEFSSARQLVDDLGYNAPGYNNADLHTPTIDGLAAGMPRELIEACFSCAQAA